MDILTILMVTAFIVVFISFFLSFFAYILLEVRFMLAGVRSFWVQVFRDYLSLIADILSRAGIPLAFLYLIFCLSMAFISFLV